MHSLDAIFKPRSIAIIGATTRKGSIGREILRNLFDYEFNGKIFPVNPRYENIHSVKAYPTVLSIPDAVDLAVIIVPKEHVMQAVEDCGRKGVKGLVIISAGFREVGGEGIKREEAIVAAIRKHGMRLIGPNCMGVIAAIPDVQMNATFSPAAPSLGNLAMMSQSGALGVAILLAAQKLNLGMSYFASVGNKADVSAPDLLEYWENDPHTDVIALYLESFGEPQRFFELSKRISKKKPIVVVKSGTSAAGARAASSHTGAMASLEVAVEALLQQAGVVRVSTIEEMIDVVAGFARAPVPRGNRVCIVTNAGGPGIMAADNVEAQGLVTAELSPKTQEAMRRYLPPEASVRNPVDMVAGAGPDEYEKILDLALADDGVDLAIAIFVPPLMIEPIEVMRRITRVGRAYDKPVLSVLMAEERYYEMIPREIPDAVPFYKFPEAAANVAAQMNRHREWRAVPAGKVRTFKADAKRARAIIDAKIEVGGGYLAPSDAYDVLDAFGFPVCKHRTVATDGDIAAAAKATGYPVVLKVVGEGIVHKSDIGGVVVGIDSRDELLAARKEMEKKLRAAGAWDAVTGFLVQEMASAGKEVILGVVRDPRLGPLLMFGMGGKYVEILRDVVFRVMPVTDIDAAEMVHRIKSYPLLEGVRGDVPVDIDFIVECIQRLAHLVTTIDGIEELDMNPVMVHPERAHCRVLDARIRVRAAKASI
ncbi:MAG: acetate--CoA ligase family protein [Candidatus Krumholzibacteria bacterium]|nr:acetate--CoA ligase family protein [Candidatus Krumholzibacteria bacterium]